MDLIDRICQKTGKSPVFVGKRWFSLSNSSLDEEINCRYPLSQSEEFLNNVVTQNYKECDCCMIPLKDPSSLASRSGSWSDSGYCCEKSDAETSRFSSLSFSERLNTEDCISEDPCTSESSKSKCEEKSRKSAEYALEDCREFLANLQIPGEADPSDFRPNASVFDNEYYSPEEQKILEEIIANPKNFHETTKELSDIARDVSSKGWRRKHAKAMSFVSQMFRRIVGNVRKHPADKSKQQPTANEFEGENDNRSKSQRRFSIRSCSSPFRKRSSSTKTSNRSLFSGGIGNKNTIQRVNSYSSLFGRKGSLFSHTERNQNSPILKRSLSYDTLQNRKLLENCKNVDDMYTKSVAAHLATDISCSLSEEVQPLPHAYRGHTCAAKNISYEVEQEASIGEVERCYETYRSRIDDCELVAPLEINVQKERCAHTRRIKKL